MRKYCLLFSSGLLVLTVLLALGAKDITPQAGGGKLRVIELKGTPYMRGHTHGQSLKPEIQELVKRWKADLEKTYSVPATIYIEKLLEASDFQPAAPQNYVIGGPKQASNFERSAGLMVEFIPFEGAEFTYHTNHPIINDDLNPKFIEALKKRGVTLEAYKARCPRFKFLGETFKDNAAALDLAVLKRVFTDRASGINNAGTYGCTIMVLGDHPELHIAPGRPDTEAFEVLGFEHRTGVSVLSHGSQPGKTQIKFGICDWTIEKSGDPAALETAAKLGLDGVQVSLNPKGESLALFDKELQQTYLAAVKKTGAEIASFCIGELNNVPLKSDPRAERWVAEGIAVASAMKVGIILIPFFGKGDLKNDRTGIEAAIAALKRLAPRAEKARVTLALESTLSAEDNLKIIDAVGSPAVTVYYDVGNSQEAGFDIGREIRLLGGRISQFHAKDYKDLFGQGSVDFKAVRTVMKEIGYCGWLVLEEVKLPLGLEKSILQDLKYLKRTFLSAEIL